MKFFDYVSTHATSYTTQVNSEAYLRRSVIRQAGNSPTGHGRFFIFGSSASTGAYPIQGGNYPVRWAHPLQTQFPSSSFLFQGVFHD
jgi:hypothetical protein